MSTSVTNSASGSAFKPNDVDIYITKNDAQGDFTVLGNANFEAGTGTGTGGDQIGSDVSMPPDPGTFDAGFRAAIDLWVHTSRFSNDSAAVANGINLGVHANGNY